MALKVLTVGAGYFSQFHVSSWTRMKDAELAGIVDTDLNKASHLADQFAKGTRVFGDLQDALSQTTPDIIDIATPPSTHADLIAQADASRAKLIICQKPFCKTFDLAKSVTKTTKTPLVVHENFRFQPWYRAIANMIENGELGEIYQITFRFRPGDGQGPDAYLDRQPYFQSMERFLVHETAIHWIDTFRYLLGEPKSAYADLRQLNPAIKGEDAGLIVFGYENGTRAIFDGNRLVGNTAANPRLTMGECCLECAKGVLSLDGDGNLSFRKTGETQSTPIPLEFPPEAFGGDCVHAFQKHVTDHMLHGRPIENTAQDYLRNMEIEEAVYHSAATGRRVEV